MRRLIRIRVHKEVVRDYNKNAELSYLSRLWVHASQTCGASHLHLSPCTVLKKGLAGSCDLAESSGQFAGTQTSSPCDTAESGQQVSPSEI